MNDDFVLKNEIEQIRLLIPKFVEKLTNSSINFDTLKQVMKLPLHCYYIDRNSINMNIILEKHKKENKYFYIYLLCPIDLNKNVKLKDNVNYMQGCADDEENGVLKGMNSKIFWEKIDFLIENKYDCEERMKEINIIKNNNNYIEKIEEEEEEDDDNEYVIDDIYNFCSISTFIKKYKNNNNFDVIFDFSNSNNNDNNNNNIIKIVLKDEKKYKIDISNSFDIIINETKTKKNILFINENNKKNISIIACCCLIINKYKKIDKLFINNTSIERIIDKLNNNTIKELNYSYFLNQ